MQLFLFLIIAIFSFQPVLAEPSGTAKKELKILILIIASDTNPAYSKLQKVWEAYMNSDPKHFDAYFIRGDADLAAKFEIKRNEITVKTHESLVPGIINKTLLSLEALQPSLHEYDYIIRTNLSSFYVFPKLLTFLETLPRANCYGGVPLFPCELSPEFLNIRFIWGAGIIMSNDVVQTLLNESCHYEKYKAEVPDDVFIGLIFQKKNIPLTYAPRNDYPTKATWLNNKKSIPENAFHFRAKSHHLVRQETDSFTDELFILNELLEQFYGIKDCKTDNVDFLSKNFISIFNQCMH